MKASAVRQDDVSVRWDCRAICLGQVSTNIVNLQLFLAHAKMLDKRQEAQKVTITTIVTITIQK